MLRKRNGVAAVALAVSAVSGCGTVSERRDDVRAATEHFERALRTRQFARLCAVLAPVTRQELEQSAGSRCEEGMRGERLPEGGRIVRVDVHGRQARAVLAQDTVFLSQFPTGWKVVAAGCTERPGRPYQCEIKGE